MTTAVDLGRKATKQTNTRTYHDLIIRYLLQDKHKLIAFYGYFALLKHFIGDF